MTEIFVVFVKSDDLSFVTHLNVNANFLSIFTSAMSMIEIILQFYCMYTLSLSSPFTQRQTCFWSRMSFTIKCN